MSWVEDAACKGVDTDKFFPRRGDDPKIAWSLIKEYCDTCPVKAQCLDLALSDRHIAGIWGGTTMVDRRRRKYKRIKLQGSA